jgi:hypothetical protein
LRTINGRSGDGYWRDEKARGHESRLNEGVVCGHVFFKLTSMASAAEGQSAAE